MPANERQLLLESEEIFLGHWRTKPNNIHSFTKYYQTTLNQTPQNKKTINKVKVFYEVIVAQSMHDMQRKDYQNDHIFQLTYAFNAASTEILSEGIHALSEDEDFLFIAVLMLPNGFMFTT